MQDYQCSYVAVDALCDIKFDSLKTNLLEERSSIKYQNPSSSGNTGQKYYQKCAIKDIMGKDRKYYTEIKEGGWLV